MVWSVAAVAVVAAVTLAAVADVTLAAAVDVTLAAAVDAIPDALVLQLPLQLLLDAEPIMLQLVVAAETLVAILADPDLLAADCCLD